MCALKMSRYPASKKKRKNHQVTSTDRWVRRRVKNVSFYPFFRHEFCIIICRTRPSFLFLTGKWAKKTCPSLCLTNKYSSLSEKKKDLKKKKTLFEIYDYTLDFCI